MGLPPETDSSINWVALPVQAAGCENGAIGYGSTVIENDAGGPAQPFKLTLILITLLCATVGEPLATNEGISVLPLVVVKPIKGESTVFQVIAAFVGTAFMVSAGTSA